MEKRTEKTCKGHEERIVQPVYLKVKLKKLACNSGIQEKTTLKVVLVHK